MVAVNFPNSPTLNAVHTSGGKSWKWDGTIWQPQGATSGGGGGWTRLAKKSPAANQQWIEFTNIPSGTDMMKFLFEGVRPTSNNYYPTINIGDSGGFEDDAYRIGYMIGRSAQSVSTQVALQSTGGFRLYGTSDSYMSTSQSMSGMLTATRHDGNTWHAEWSAEWEGTNSRLWTLKGNGYKTLSAELDRIRVGFPFNGVYVNTAAEAIVYHQ